MNKWSYYIGIGLDKLRRMNQSYTRWGDDITRLDLYPRLTVQDIDIVTRFREDRSIIYRRADGSYQYT